MTPQLVELVALLATTLFAGAAIYVSAVEHPARMSCGTEIAATEWVPSYKRAAIMQASLAAVAALFGALRTFQGGDPLWGWSAAVIFLAIPYTLIVIRPTNNRLLDPARDRRSAETRALLESWARHHMVRTALGIVAAVLCVWAAVRG